MKINVKVAPNPTKPTVPLLYRDLQPGDLFCEGRDIFDGSCSRILVRLDGNKCRLFMHRGEIATNDVATWDGNEKVIRLHCTITVDSKESTKDA